jgi:hypothetical protein
MLVDPFSWLWVVIGATVILGILRAARPRWSVTIVVRPGVVTSFRGVPTSQKCKITEFFENDLALDRRVTIRAMRGRSGRLHVAFSGRLDPGTRQRIRNFLNTRL